MYIYVYIYLFIIYIRPISCNKPVKHNSVFSHVKYKEDRILFGRFITCNWPIYIYIYITNYTIESALYGFYSLVAKL